ncbi:fibroblast growth factor receptor homolog 1-like isoform X2 [Episyrphus balteatus]|uniref:fibroblast growth factor receptor homolog 1-like isoform X2 n=1 Tax=Episyrphus balteatus TaxID=286459 RepID=UPI00248599BC|nr:fibroblast growth factor receptor homolog 1-like isoform X2 [Episyrphus balteatus]
MQNSTNSHKITHSNVCLFTTTSQKRSKMKILRKLTAFPDLLTNSLVLVILVISIFQINYVASRKLPSQSTTAPTEFETVEFILDGKSKTEEKVPANSRIQLRCKFENPIWFKNDEKLNTDIRRSKTLKFEKIKKTDAGIYSCRSDTDGSWANLTLSVSPAGEMKADFAGNMQSFSQVSQVAAEVAEALVGNSNTTTTDTDHQHHRDKSSDDYVDKELEENADTDQDDNNHHTEDGHPQEYAPRFKPKTVLPKYLPKPSGSFIKLNCAVYGVPTPNITWTKNEKPISRSMGKVVYKKWGIQMEDSIPEDSGNYTCLVCNIHGCTEHTTRLYIQDRVNHKPIILTPLSNLTLHVNGTGEMKCKYLSDLHQEIAWTFTACKNERCSKNRSIIKVMTDPDMTNVLKLENVTHDDEGWYTCIAANSLGQTTSTAYLTVVDEILEKDMMPISLPIRNHGVWVTIVCVVTILLFLVASTFIVYVLRKLKHEKLLKHRMETVHQWTKKVIIYKPSADPSSPETMIMPIIKIEKQRTTLLQSSNTDPAPFNEYEFPLDSNWEIPRNQLILGNTLGEGAFGRVVMAEATGLSKYPGSCIVAVKMVKEGHTDADMASLVREMEVMKMIGKHINIINLLGCCSQDGPLYVIVEFAPHGNLKDFLKKNRPPSSFEMSMLENNDREHLTEKNLISFAFQVARGMEYLASRRCIHRDLAARNVLVSDDYVIKIADFGLARDIQDTDYYRKNTNGRLPIKWMAPESLQEKFYDTQSDVWSYGVLLWEIMTYGEQPYPQIMSAEELYSYLMSGQRMEKPQRCSLNIYMLMRQCWHFDANARPTFTEIVENLDKILLAKVNANEEYLDLALPILETPPSSDEESDTDTLRETTLLRYHY